MGAGLRALEAHVLEASAREREELRVEGGAQRAHCKERCAGCAVFIIQPASVPPLVALSAPDATASAAGGGAAAYIHDACAKMAATRSPSWGHARGCSSNFLTRSCLKRRRWGGIAPDTHAPFELAER